jgi:hypothetical protein
MRPVVRQNPHPGDIPTIGTAAGRAPAGSYLSSVVHGPGGDDPKDAFLALIHAELGARVAQVRVNLRIGGGSVSAQ